MIPLLTILLVLAFAYYLLFLWRVWRGLGKLYHRAATTGSSVSIVIAARNEESTIGRCLESLLQQDYPSDKFEIIVVDDHSTDRTADIARSFMARERGSKISLVTASGDSEPIGKPYAIAKGIHISRGDIMLLTDADCIAPRGWIRSMVSFFEPPVAFVAGPVLETPNTSRFSKLFSLEFLGLITSSAGLIGSGKPIICNGANIAYRKSVFIAVSGFGDGASSCDDETLMQRIITRKVGQVVFNPDHEAAVTTAAPASLHEFWKQRTRWAAKRGRYEDSALVWQLTLLYLFFAIALATAIVAFVEPTLRYVLLPVLLAKMIADLLVLRKGAQELRQKVPLAQFVIAELLHVPYIAVAGLAGQFLSLRWKGRTLEK